MAKNKTKKLTTMAMLFALAIVLSFVESLIAPMFALPPGVKLGLGNIVVMYCMVYMGYSSAFQVSALKGLFSFLTRGFTAGVLSFTGGASVCLLFWSDLCYLHTPQQRLSCGILFLKILSSPNKNV